VRERALVLTNHNGERDAGVRDQPECLSRIRHFSFHKISVCLPVRVHRTDVSNVLIGGGSKLTPGSTFHASFSTLKRVEKEREPLPPPAGESLPLHSQEVKWKCTRKQVKETFHLLYF
jgi:hypothetical protein